MTLRIYPSSCSSGLELEGHSNPGADFSSESIQDEVLTVDMVPDVIVDDGTGNTTAPTDDPPPYDGLLTISSTVSLPSYTPKPDGMTTFPAYPVWSSPTPHSAYPSPLSPSLSPHPVYLSWSSPHSAASYLDQPTVFDSVVYPPPPPRYSTEPGWVWGPNEPRHMVWPPVGDHAGATLTPAGLGSNTDAALSQCRSTPPNDYMTCAVFATLCCCWLIGISALTKARECRSAIDAGNFDLAFKKSREARRRISFSIFLGALTVVLVTGFIAIRYGMLN